MMVIRHGRQYTTTLTHTVELLCACDDIENCQMERYASDVRKAYEEIQRLAVPREGQRLTLALPRLTSS